MKKQIINTPDSNANTSIGLKLSGMLRLLNGS